MKFFRHTTIEGERWDHLAARYRTTPYDYVDIIQNNPLYQGLFILPEGIVLSIPVLEENTTRRILPPWERQENL